MARVLWIAGGLLLSLLVVEFLPLPFLWLFWGLCAVCLVRSVRSRHTAARIVYFNLAACCLILGIAEGVYLARAHPPAPVTSPPVAGEAVVLPDDVLGYAPIPDRHFDDPPVAGSSDGPRSPIRDRLSRSFLFDEVLRGTVVYGEQIDRLVAIVEASQRFVERRWPGCEFHVILWNERYQLKSLQLERALSHNGFRLHRIGDMIPDYLDDKLKYWIAASDRHPNALAHRRIADYIAQRILRK